MRTRSGEREAGQFIIQTIQLALCGLLTTCYYQARRKLEEEKKALVAFVCDLDSSLPSLRGLSTPTSQTFPPMTGTGFKPTLSALAESNPNTPSSSPARKPTGRVSSLTMALPGSGRGTLFDQLPPEDIMLPLDSDDKENDLL